ncbi:MAG: inorganic pyrophosphatase [Parcubacteria group bacterium CG10_big_fil_rev_8_21_14_0_10_38_31]|nr:MAG: inorganic pyrophosphatase [Parcubacteria group bacterium CG10_big_fil_rev_8_21_14_0_10_38_31]
MNLWHDIKPGDKEKLNVVIEIPKLSRIKYELDKESGLIKVDRVLYSPMHYPANYGFVPKTLWDDGDPLDVLVLSHEPFVPGCLVEVRPIGVLDMKDDGEGDAKVLSVPTKDPRFNNIKDISDLEPHTLEEIIHFFKVYKDLQKKEVLVEKWKGKEKAFEAIEHSFVLYNEKYPA